MLMIIRKTRNISLWKYLTFGHRQTFFRDSITGFRGSAHVLQKSLIGYDPKYLNKRSFAIGFA